MEEARWNMYKPIYFAASMLEAGEVDALVRGDRGQLRRDSASVAPGHRRRGGGSEGRGPLYARLSRTGNFSSWRTPRSTSSPTPATLAEIALQTAVFVRELGIEPRIAMVSFSNFGSADHPEAARVAEAVRLVRAEDPELEIDGEMQADTAVDAVKLRELSDSAI